MYTSKDIECLVCVGCDIIVFYNLIFHLCTVFHMESVGMCMTYFCTKFHLPVSSDPLFITIIACGVHVLCSTKQLSEQVMCCVDVCFQTTLLNPTVCGPNGTLTL